MHGLGLLTGLGGNGRHAAPVGAGGDRRDRPVPLLAALTLAVGVVAIAACSPTPSLPTPSLIITPPDQASPSPTPSPLESVPVASVDVSPAPLGDSDWELLADLRQGEAGTIAVATSREAFTERWLQTYPGKPGPETRLQDPVFVFFNIVVDHGCPEAVIDDVMVDSTTRLIYGVFTRIGTRPNCGDIADNHTFVVAVSRAALPTGLMTFRLERDFFRSDVYDREREQVQVEL